MKATNLTAADAAVDDHYLNSVDMAVGAYTLDETLPNVGAHKVTITHTSGDTTDTLGTVTIVGWGLDGAVVTEAMTPSADATVTSDSWFAGLVSATGAGWVIDAVEGTEDTIEIGYGSDVIVGFGEGAFEAVVVNKTAAGTIIIADAGGTIATLKASIAEGSYEFGCDYHGYLLVTLGAASDVTVVNS